MKVRHKPMAGARGIEPRSRVLETLILTIVLCPFMSRMYLSYQIVKKDAPMSSDMAVSDDTVTKADATVGSPYSASWRTSGLSYTPTYVDRL